MKKLVTISTPQEVDILFRQLFVECAADAGCGANLYMTAAGDIVCDRACTDCKLPEILAAYHRERNQFASQMVRSFATGQLRKALFRRSPARHQRLRKAAKKPYQYDC